MMQVINMAQANMTPEQFVYWLQGFLEMADPQTLTEAQVKMLKEHLALVFAKKTNTLGDLMQPQLAPMPTYPMPQDGTVFPQPQPPYIITCSAIPKDGEEPKAFIC